MTKSISAALQTHLEGTVTTLAMCWHITRTDGTEYFFTTHDQSITITTGDFTSDDFDPDDFYTDDVYLPAGGFEQTAIANDSSMAVDNMNMAGILNSDSLAEADLRAGRFDFAEVEVFLVNWADTSQGVIKLRKGRFGEVTVSPTGVFNVELRGLTQQLSQSIIEVYTPDCRADLGDSRCKAPINPDVRESGQVYALGEFIRVSAGVGFDSGDFDPSDFDTGAYAQYSNRIYECTTAGTTASTQPTYDTVVGNTTTDGTAVFTAREAWTRSAVVATVSSRKVFTLTITETRAVNDWFNGGVLQFDSGLNTGIAMEIRDWVQSSSTVTLFLSVPFDIAVGDKCHLYPGCDKRLSTCSTKFAIPDSLNFDNGNVYNFRGEPFVPGQDEYFRTPEPK